MWRSIAEQTLALLTIGGTRAFAIRTMPRSTITTASGMTVDGGEVTTHGSCLCSAGGGTGTLVAGIQPGGYDPYAYYPYDGPIYGYGNLTPDRVIVNVQVALQEQGYYAGPIDGDLGPQTRAALAAYQADRGLAVTSAVDRPTLQTLGLA